jgi:hypothetical protein
MSTMQRRNAAKLEKSGRPGGRTPLFGVLMGGQRRLIMNVLNVSDTAIRADDGQNASGHAVPCPGPLPVQCAIEITA